MSPLGYALPARPPLRTHSPLERVSYARALGKRVVPVLLSAIDFDKPAEQALTEGRYDAALRLAAAGAVLGEHETMRLLPQQIQSVPERTSACFARRR